MVLFVTDRRNNYEGKRYIMKKRIAALFTAIILVFALAACGGPKTLADLLKTDAWQAEVKGANDSVASTGITVTTEADGNVLVFKYHLPDEEAYNAVTAEMGEQMVEQLISTFKAGDMLNDFRNSYNVPIDAIRVGYYRADGSEIASGEVRD